MSVAPPPLPKPVTSFREITATVRLGDSLGLFKVVESTPDSLRLSVSAGWMILMGIASMIMAVIAFAIFWYTPATIHTVSSEVGGTSLTVAIIAGLLGPVLLANIGHSMEIDRIRKIVRVTWVYFRTREYPADRLKAVVLEFKKPSTSTATVQKSDAAGTAGSPKPTFSNSADCFLEGIDQQGQPLRVKVADCALSLKDDWPALAAAAIHVSKVLRLPLQLRGAIDQLNPTTTQQVATITSLSK